MTNTVKICPRGKRHELCEILYLRLSAKSKHFYPKQYVESVYEIPFEKLAKKGVKGVLFDIDNTLVPHGAPADEKAVELFARLRAIGLKTCLISNNKEPRVKSFAQAVGSLYIYKGGKPGRKGYIKAMELAKTDQSSTIFVGDQLFTDIWGANRTGIKSILVKPINPKEEIQIVLKRYLEKPVLYCYRKSLKKG